VGLSYRLVFGVQEAAMQARLNATWYQLLFRGIGTGALIYLAVELKKKYESLLPVVLCVMSFILAGFQHSIANCTYFGMTSFSLYGLLGILIVIIGNSIGSLLIRFLQVKGGNNNTKLNE
jgi:nitrite transporter